jgi:very-short-patch-repair endonuclease
LKYIKFNGNGQRLKSRFGLCHGFVRKRFAKKLNELVIGEGKSETDKDIELLVRIRALRAEISALNVNIEAESVWTGLTTRTELVQCALDFQHALNAAKNGQNWEEVGFELIANGHCSMKMSADLNELRILKILDADLKSLESLGLPTSGLWAGLSTQILQLQAALKFQEALRDIRDSGTLNGDHTVVANEKCGTILYKDFKILRSRESVENQIAEYGNLQDITSGLWSGLKTNTEKINNTLKISSYLTSVITNLANTSDQMRALKASLEYLFGNGNALTKTGGSLDEIGGEYSNALTALYPEIESLILAGSFTEKSKTKFIELPLNEIIEQCNSIINTENQLHSWCAWRKVCDQARVAGLASLVEGLENNSMIGTPLQLAFETNYCRWWLNTVVEGEPIIKSFVSVEHEKRIDDYRALDDRFTELTRSWVRASLCAELPTQDSVTKNSEWGILRHEINKKKRHISLRELISRIPLALPKLTPCLLMSPLSIAQYFSTNTTLFDVVVFDEASQIPVWDAVGAIARGKQVVMVGDPKQLPPTNFFNRTESDLDDEDIEGDLESILDECMGANIPTMNLSWHYRSRHESLIAFSNHHYYGGSLVTFPSPFTEDHAVSFHYIKGVYEKGGARINKPEAMALVADLINKLKSPGFSESKLTIGVVTFNSEQQSLIEDLLDDERRKDPSIEPHFAEIELEPIFVKNLESVQGDERDIMYFSVTYGPDLAGVTSMNFGPMNRNGGERRLNVAITRARHELRVFSSLKPDQLNLARTQAHGVRDLKHFLEFAERGPRALAEEISGSRDDFESPFEEAVASALARKGWELHTQIGVSTFRVDLGVVHPDRPGTYLTGIECDGATYHRSATARDRDKLREQVLRGLGWEILRVWSTDWWINPIGTLEKIDASLKCLLETSRLKRTSEAETEAARLISEEALTLVSDKVISSPQLNDSGKDTPAYVYATSSPMNEKPAGNFHFLDNAPPNLFVEADPCSVMNGINSGIFFDANYEPLLHQMIAYVIEVEGPVLDSVLARRVARAHGWQRTGTRIQKRVDALAAIAHQVTQEEVGTFYWPQNIGPEIPLQFRSVANNVSRAVGEICMPELISLAREVMKSGKMGDDVVIGMAREMGLQRLMGPSKERLGKASRQAGLGNTLPAQTQDDSACTTSN